MEFFLCKDHYGMCEEEKKTLEDKMSVFACARWRVCWLKIRKRILLSKNKKQKKKEFHIQSTETKHRNKIEISQVSSFGYSTPVWLFVCCCFDTVELNDDFFFLNEN